jgi:hypothetical protein
MSILTMKIAKPLLGLAIVLALSCPFLVSANIGDSQYGVSEYCTFTSNAPGGAADYIFG